MLAVSCCGFYSQANDNLQLSGFGTLGLTLADSDIYGFRYDVSQPNGVYKDEIDFSVSSLIGGQAEFTITPEFDVVTQAVIKKRFNADIDDYIELAFLRYNPSPDWTFRVGRMGANMFMMTEYRDISYAYTMTTPPPEFYGLIPHRQLDGIEAIYRQPVDRGILQASLSYGRSEAYIVSDSFEWNVKLSPILLMALDYEYDNWLFRLNATRAKTTNTSDPGIFVEQFISELPESVWPNKDKTLNRIKSKDKYANYYGLGFKYDNFIWQVQSEIAYIDYKTESLPDSLNGYLNVTKRFDEHAVFAGISSTRSHFLNFTVPPLAKQIPELEENFLSYVNFYGTNQTTLSAGWRWDYAENWAFKLQLNRTQPQRGGDRIYLKSVDGGHENAVHSLILSVSFIF
ncbi:hypothetical protein [Flocculibacter collagenilyticus]|uniref:hypothetical protein n=1 Tax=Flocculibacter collagenilyticus TaxID=2744479 RepID=UPI0018F5CF94|nr:hypothetical protein [Flocculibacter collagenilyticus]